MSPHQRVLAAAVFTLKSRRIRSARVAAAGSGMVVRLKRRGLPSAQPGSAHQPGHTLAAVPVAAAAQVGVNAWGAVAALGRLVGRSDVLGELLVDAVAGCDVGGAVGVVGGTGDLQQLARALEGALLGSLRLDERIDVHRVSFAKKAVARLRISTSPRSRWFSRRRAASSWR